MTFVIISITIAIYLNVAGYLARRWSWEIDESTALIAALFWIITLPIRAGAGIEKMRRRRRCESIPRAKVKT